MSPQAVAWYTLAVLVAAVYVMARVVAVLQRATCVIGGENLI